MRLLSIFFAIVLAAFPSLSNLAAAESISDDTLSEQAVIRRDTYGVPHILAETEEAASFAYGYAAAEDHVLTIARLYLGARSEEAKYFGGEFTESDLMTKKLRIYRVSEERFNEFTPFFQRTLNAYARGYSRYVEQHRADLPEWVKPISGIDAVAHSRNVIIKEFCMNLRQIEELNNPTQTASTDARANEIGSNVWAINGDRSASGNAILLGNPHLRWGGSHTWHEAQITVPGKINFLGATLIGLPGGGVGFNEHLGWSHTVNPHDCDDIYELELDPTDPNAYLYDGRAVPMEKETIAVEVKTDDGLETVREDVYWTHYGPIVSRKGGKAYAYKSPHFNEVRFLEQWYLLSKATSFKEFRAILDMQALPMFNIGYADAEGNCFYLFNGRFPDRPEGYDWNGIVPGGTPDTEWYSILPTSRLPQVLNPKSGYIANSNSSPWYTNLGQILDRHDYPSELCPLGNSLRSQMGTTMLEADRSISFEEILEYKYNTNLLLADRVKRDLIKLVKGHSVDGLDLSDAAEVLSEWDNKTDPASVGAVLFVNFWDNYRKLTDTPFARPWVEAHPASTPRGIGDDEAAIQAMADTVRQLNARGIGIRVPWGAVFRMRMGDLDIPIGGLTTDYGAFRVIGYRPAADGRMVAAGGDSYVFAVEFSKPIRAKNIMAYSQSEDPASPHFADQARLFASHGWKDALYYEADIAANLERSYHP